MSTAGTAGADGLDTVVGGQYTYRDGERGGSGRYCTLPKRELSLST